MLYKTSDDLLKSMYWFRVLDARVVIVLYFQYGSKVREQVEQTRELHEN